MLPQGHLNKTPLVVNGKCGISRRAGTSARFSEKIEAVKARGFGGAKSSPVLIYRCECIGIPPQKKPQTFVCGNFCGGSRIRTGDPMLAKHVLYQLSYTPVESSRGCPSLA